VIGPSLIAHPVGMPVGLSACPLVLVLLQLMSRVMDPGPDPYTEPSVCSTMRVDRACRARWSEVPGMGYLYLAVRLEAKV